MRFDSSDVYIRETVYPFAARAATRPGGGAGDAGLFVRNPDMGYTDVFLFTPTTRRPSVLPRSWASGGTPVRELAFSLERVQRPARSYLATEAKR